MPEVFALETETAAVSEIVVVIVPVSRGYREIRFHAEFLFAAAVGILADETVEYRAVSLAVVFEIFIVGIRAREVAFFYIFGKVFYIFGILFGNLLPLRVAT